jgi:TetR/AcrR family transcriptional regulator
VTRNLNGEDRRSAIAEAVIPVFVRHGFDGATRKKLANAAGVSETLLYKYFPSKEAIYQLVVVLRNALKEAAAAK